MVLNIFYNQLLGLKSTSIIETRPTSIALFCTLAFAWNASHGLDNSQTLSYLPVQHMTLHIATLRHLVILPSQHFATWAFRHNLSFEFCHNFSIKIVQAYAGVIWMFPQYILAFLAFLTLVCPNIIASCIGGAWNQPQWTTISRKQVNIYLFPVLQRCLFSSWWWN